MGLCSCQAQQNPHSYSKSPNEGWVQPLRLLKAVPDTRVKSITKYLTLLPEQCNVRRQQAGYKIQSISAPQRQPFIAASSALTSRPRAAVTNLGHTAGTAQWCPENLKLIPPMVDGFQGRADFQAHTCPPYQRHWKARSTGAPPGTAL